MSSTPHYDGMIEHENLLGYFNFLLSLVDNHEGKKKNEVGISKKQNAHPILGEWDVHILER